MPLTLKIVFRASNMKFHILEKLDNHSPIMDLSCPHQVHHFVDILQLEFFVMNFGEYSFTKRKIKTILAGLLSGNFRTDQTGVKLATPMKKLCGDRSLGSSYLMLRMVKVVILTGHSSLGIPTANNRPSALTMLSPVL